MKKVKRERLSKALFWFVMFSLIASIAYIIVSIVLAPSDPDMAADGQRIKGDYALMLLQCTLGVLALFLPSFLSHKFSLKIPSGMLVLYVIFLYGAVYLGEVKNFYYHVAHWDTILHTFSGVMLGALGFSVVNILNRHEKVPMQLSPAFVAFFAFCFAVTMGVIWEFYEFACDGLMDLNMQKYKLENGTELIGRTAVIDTVKDLIVDSIGALCICIVGYFSIKLKKQWLEKFMVDKKNWWDDYTSLKLSGGKLKPLSDDCEDMLEIVYKDGVIIDLGKPETEESYVITTYDSTKENGWNEPISVFEIKEKKELVTALQTAIDDLNK